MAESAYSIVLSNVNTLAIQETTLLCGVTLEVESLKDELKRLQGFLRDADGKRRLRDEDIVVLVSQIRDVGYEADNAIEAVDHMQKRNRLKKGFMGAIARYARLPSDLTTLLNVGVEIEHIKRKISEIVESAKRLEIVDLGNVPIENVHVDDEFQQDYPNYQNYEEILLVGFEGEYEEIVEKLVDTEKSLSAISIVAMGGAGKTALAKKVFMSCRVQEHFGKTAWVTVSQKYKGIDLLKEIMKQIMGSTDESIDKLNEYEVGQKIHDFLLQTKCLVVLDDVWETDTWEQLNRSIRAFPDAANGSRILITTRKDIANHVQIPTHVHPLKKLDEEKSWELLSSKALPSYKRSVIHDVDEFEKLGRKLAKKCDGLPLALALLGGYLSKHLNAREWSDILLDWPSTRNGQMVQNIVARSYKDLPNHYLRSCFLYIASYPKDYIIDVPRLIELWIAEGFIPKIPNHKLEETAEMYVAELAQRSLVEVIERSRAHGCIDIIKIHDILHDWCAEEARQDGFLDVKNETTGQVGEPASSNNLVSYRSSFQSLSNEILPGTTNIRTLLGFELQSASVPKLRLLRVLSIEKSTLKDFCTVISGCIHLRYLRLGNCGGVVLPSSIGQLLYLQTIDLRDSYLESQVPKSLWDIPSLRNVYLDDGFSPPPPPAKSVRLHHKELQTLFLGISHVGTKLWFHDMVIFLRQMNQLRTLFLMIFPMPTEVFSLFANMPHLVDITLGQLGVLDKLPDEFPQSVRRLVLYADVIRQDPMPILEKLPCLVVLKLEGYEGKTMSCSAQGFPQLQELELHRFSVEEWRTEEGTMSKLFILTLWKCEKMIKVCEELLDLSYLSHVTLAEVPYF
ncbi:hypothetical protein CFC21_106291 [Triticum aestivum]|uniref:NB-ARC domain-containing protein n=2 Tax=Triticum aestivum TaxID=4565 RepID=A0A3B6SVZ0_WHEAT|nr:hypothetical protein CFC21_106291 [Triticum aestivum]